jgi:hypothetical protein
LVGSERLPIVPTVKLHVAAFEMGERILRGPTILHEPCPELLQCGEVEVPGLYAERFLAPLRLHLGKGRHDARWVDVAEEGETALLDCPAHAGHNLANLLFRRSLRDQCGLECVHVNAEGRLAVVVVAVDDSGLLQLHAPENVGQHGAGGVLVRGERNATADTEGVDVAAVPLLAAASLLASPLGALRDGLAVGVDVAEDMGAEDVSHRGPGLSEKRLPPRRFSGRARRRAKETSCENYRRVFAEGNSQERGLCRKFQIVRIIGRYFRCQGAIAVVRALRCATR